MLLFTLVKKKKKQFFEGVDNGPKEIWVMTSAPFLVFCLETSFLYTAWAGLKPAILWSQSLKQLKLQTCAIATRLTLIFKFTGQSQHFLIQIYMLQFIKAKK